MKITVETVVRAEPAKVWAAWNTPEDIMQWNAASEDWHTTQSAVDLREGGEFSSRMEAKDGSMGFDFAGTYTRVVPGQLLEYALGDERAVSIRFEETPDGVRVTETFDGDNEYPEEFQKQGWQSILDNFRRHVEAKG